MSRDIDFSSLSLQDTLDLAIAVEDEACERYLEFADQLAKHHTGEVAAFFTKMAGIERTHAERLGERRRALFADAATTADLSLVVDVEAPEYGEVRAFMGVQKALDVAFEAEVKAYDFYDGALASVEDDEVRGLFEFLREQEVQHQKMIREFGARLPRDPDVDAEDFVDEPQAQ
jgi:rubrerythrin